MVHLGTFVKGVPRRRPCVHKAPGVGSPTNAPRCGNTPKALSLNAQTRCLEYTRHLMSGQSQGECSRLVHLEDICQGNALTRALSTQAPNLGSLGRCALGVVHLKHFVPECPEGG